MTIGSTVAGINVSLGIDLEPFLQGIGRAEVRVANFKKDVARIKLEGIVKGDPFSITKKHISEAGKAINAVFKDWSVGITEFSTATDKMARKINSNVSKVNEAFVKMNTRLKTISLMKPIGDSIFNEGRFKPRGKSTSVNIQTLFSGKEELAKFYNGLTAISKESGPLAQAAINDVLSKINKNIKVKITDLEGLKDHFNRIMASMWRDAGKIIQEGTMVNARLQRAADIGVSPMQQRMWDTGAAAPRAGLVAQAERRRVEEITSLNTAIAHHNAEIKIGVDVESNLAAIQQKSLRLQELKAKLTDQQINSIRRYNDELKRQATLEIQTRTGMTAMQRNTFGLDKSPMLAGVKGDQIVAIHSLVKETNYLNAAVKQNIDVESNRAKWLQNTIELQRMGARLTNEQVRALINYTDELKRQAILEIQTRTGMTAMQRNTFGLDKSPMLAGVKGDHITYLHNLTKETNYLNAAVKQNINVEENRAKWLQNILQLQKNGITLTKEQTDALKRYNAAQIGVSPMQKNMWDRPNSILTPTKISKYNTYMGTSKSGLSEDPTAARIRIESYKKAGLAILDLRKANLDLMSTLKARINVDETRAKLLENINKLLSMNQRLTIREKAIKDASEGYGRNEISRIKILQERDEKTRKLAETNRYLNAQMREGINIDKNRATIAQNLIRSKELGNELSKKEILLIKQYNQENVRAAKANASGGFLSPQWLGQRMVWFLQLRLAWGAYRAMGDGVRDLIDLQDQLARAMRTASSVISSQTSIAKQYTLAMQQAAVSHGASWKDIGETLYQLGSAGLSAEESLAALNTTLSLNIGLEGDAKETTKLVASIYKNFSDDLKEFSTTEEKFTHITDIMTGTWKKHQVELPELVDAYKQSAVMAKEAGINFKQLTAILGVSADFMMRGGQAGRALTNVLMRMSRGSVAFARAFKITDVFDPTEPLQFTKIMEVLHKRMGEGTLSAYQLAAAFKNLGIRGAPEFEIIVKHWDLIAKELDRHNDMMGDTAKMEVERLKHIGGAWSKFVGGLRAELSNLEEELGIFDKLAHVFRLGGERLSDKAAIRTGKEVYSRLLSGELQNSQVSGEQKKILIEYRRVALEELFALRRKIALNKLIMPGDENYGKELARQSQLEFITSDIGQRINIPRGDMPTTDQKKSLQLINSGISDMGREIRQRTGELTQEEALLRITEDKAAVDQDILLNKIKISKLEKEGRATGISAVGSKVKKEERTSLAIAQNIEGTQEEIVKLLDRKDKLIKTESDIYKEIEAGYNDFVSNEKKSLELIKEKLGYQIKSAEEQRDLLELKYVKPDEEPKILALNEKIMNLKNHQLDIDKISDHYAKKNVDLIDLAAEHGKKANKDEKNKADEKTKISALYTKRMMVALETEEKLNTVADKRTQREIESGDNAKELLILDLERVDIEIDRHQQYIVLTKDLEEQKRYYERIRDLARERLYIEENIKKETMPVHGAYKDLLGNTQNWNQFLRGGIGQAHGIATEGLTGIGTDITGGFQEQRQAIAELEVELQGLDKEYENAIGDDNLQQAADIKDQMAGIRDEIEKLNDPIRTLGESFRVFFKDFIDQLREATIRWLVFNALTKVVGGFAGANPASIATGEPYIPGIVGPTAANGGMLPQIKAFKSFSSGGMTSRPTLALLGDNKSKKELVIPTENIHENNVSGYMRDGQQAINIINVLTEDDVVGVMAGVKGSRVVLNMVGADLRRGGVVSRSMRV